MIPLGLSEFKVYFLNPSAVLPLSSSVRWYGTCPFTGLRLEYELSEGRALGGGQTLDLELRKSGLNHSVDISQLCVLGTSFF